MPEIRQHLTVSLIVALEPIMRRRGVVGVSGRYQRKKIGDVETLVPCIRFYVDKKRPRWLCHILRCLVPSMIEGVKTDVWAVGRLEAQQDPHKQRHDILQGGISFCHYKLTAATLGIIGRDIDTKKPKELSNCHVIYNVDNPGGDCSKVGDPQLQPGPTDGGKDPQDRAGYGERWIPLEGSYPGGIGDAAVAEVRDERPVKIGEILHLGKIKGVRTPELGMTLRGCCRNGDFTVQVYETEAIVQVFGYGCINRNQYCFLRKQVMYQPGLGPGSSGTVMVDKDGYAVVLNAFGSGSAGTGNGGGAWITEIMEPLNLTFEDEEPPPPPPEGEFEYSLDEGETWKRAKLLWIRGVSGPEPQATIRVKVDGKDVGAGDKVEAELEAT